MNFPGFVGQSYQAAAIAADYERTMNLFAEAIPAAGGEKGRLVLYRTPGLALQQTFPDSPNRGAFAVNGRCFAVAGQTFYELLAPNVSIVRGTLAAPGTSPVSLRSNSVQICIVADGAGYIFTLASNEFAEITGQNGFPTYAIGLTTIDTYFLVLSQGTNQFSLSAPLDGTMWSGLDFGSTQEPDYAVALEESHLYLWVFGNEDITIFQDTGNSSFPFQRVSGTLIEQGCGAAKSIVSMDNTLYWLGDDSRGPAVVYRANGFLPERISTHAMEYAMQQYPTRADAVAYAYQESGHLFYMLHFPSANAGAGATWCYDRASGMWHERGSWNADTATYAAFIGRFHAYCFGVHLVFHYATGAVYQMSQTFADDAGNPLRWLRAAPHLTQEQAWLFYSSFQLDMQTGGGLPNNATPYVMIRWSDDGGYTWSNYRQVACGNLGEYKKRVITRRLGRSRNRVFEVSGSDPLPQVCLVGAYLELAGSR